MTEHPVSGPGVVTSSSRLDVSKVGMYVYPRDTHRLIPRGEEKILETLFDIFLSYISHI